MQTFQICCKKNLELKAKYGTMWYVIYQIAQGTCGYMMIFEAILCFVLNCSIAFPNETSPLAVHATMFIPTLESLTSPEQKEKWLPRAANYEIMGTFAQTELGHGNDLILLCFM